MLRIFTTFLCMIFVLMPSSVCTCECHCLSFFEDDQHEDNDVGEHSDQEEHRHSPDCDSLKVEGKIKPTVVTIEPPLESAFSTVDSTIAIPLSQDDGARRDHVGRSRDCPIYMLGCALVI